MAGRIKQSLIVMKYKNCLPSFTVLITLFLSNFLVGQSIIKGHIFNNVTREPLHKAEIAIEGTDESTLSDIDGYFLLKTNQNFPLTLLISYPNFADKEIKLTAANEELVIFLESKLMGSIVKENEKSFDDLYDEIETVTSLPNPEATDPSMLNFLNAKFPFPPPECHTAYEMPRRIFSECKNLGDVEQKISSALDVENYPYRFLSVPNGFAVVTQMEQYNENGTIIKDSGTRWVHYPKQEAFSWSISYFNSLIFPKKGYLRLFVYIVTSEVYSSTEEIVSKDQAAAWHNRGVNKLPAQVANIPFSEDYTINLLLYEFEVPESNHKAQQNCPSRFPAKEHLRLSGLKSHFFSN
jgi:CarboxypepD_reg-like domain